MCIVEEFLLHNRDEATVYVAEIDLKVLLLLDDDYNFEVLLRHFSLQEQLQIRSKVQPGASRREIVNRIFSRVILNLLTGEDKDMVKEVNFQYNKYRKPSIDGVQFNISTSNDIISLIVQGTSSETSPIGVDLSHSRQKVDPSTCLEDFRGIFHQREYDFLVGIGNREERYEIFNQLWTLKEAYTKYLGVGLNVDLSKLCFGIKGKTISPLHQTESRRISSTGYFKKLKVEWTEVIEVQSQLKEDRSNKAECRSARLSPIIISAVSESPLPSNIAVYKLDIVKVLSYIIH